MDEQDKTDENLTSAASTPAEGSEAPSESAPLPNFGEYLRQAREAQGLSLKQISQKTKINTTQLDFLEHGLIEKLPNKAYVIGYVKSYAKTIGLDLEYCLRLLENAYRPSEPPPAAPPASTAQTSFKAPPGKVIGGIAAAVAVLILIIVAVQHRPTNSKAPKVAPAITPHFAVVEESPAATITATIENAVNNPAHLSATLAPTITPVAYTSTPAASSTKVANQSAGTLYRLGPSDSDTVKQIPENIRQALVAGKQNIFIMAADGDSWITYKKDHDPIRKLMLKQGENLRLVGDDVRIFAGNVTAIKIFLNNRPVEFQSTTGLKSFIFPQENIKRYKLPLFIFKEDGSVETNE